MLHGVHPHHITGVRFRQTTKLRPSDRRVRADGIVVASWPRLAELDMSSLDRVADELAELYRIRAAAIGVPERPTGGAPHSRVVWHSGLIDSAS